MENSQVKENIIFEKNSDLLLGNKGDSARNKEKLTESETLLKPKPACIPRYKIIRPHSYSSHNQKKKGSDSVAEDDLSKKFHEPHLSLHNSAGCRNNRLPRVHTSPKERIAKRVK
ncbi:hypothetical protein O3M35_006474 [Rhynocoris fuscipes]|uniref:Uncharacterized protein n=1 Tax=Rhynocoris fuscipes TaxID=488301 RepID=A0AAW1DDJ0_9HEMI